MTQANEASLCCADCGRRYGDEHGFPDLVIDDEAWAKIAPREGGGGVLCPSCICGRLHQSAIQCAGRFTSGPLARHAPPAERSAFAEGVGRFISDDGLQRLIESADTPQAMLGAALRDCRAENAELKQRLAASEAELARVTAQRDSEVASRRADYKQLVELSGGDYSVGSTMLLVKIKHRIAELEAAGAAMRSLLMRLREWDHMDTAGDGAYWREEITKALAACKGATDDDDTK